ncbi:MAG TPA: YkgJ family cysteine cluster protein [Sandaracinaceae bacterium]
MRLLLAPGVGRDEVDALALREGWRLATILPKREGRPRQLVFVSAAGTELVACVEDHRIDARYLVIDGHDPSALAERARAALRCLGIEEVRAIAARDRVRGVAWLGVVAPERACEPILGVLRAALEDPDPRVREAARFAAEACGWAELRNGTASTDTGSGTSTDATTSTGATTSARPLPERPRLRDSVQARMHVADGATKVILTDPVSASVLEIDVASWRALEAADGTRDLDGLCLALAREGLYRGERDLVQLLRELDDAGVLTDGLAVPVPPPPVVAPRTPPDRPLDVLPGFTLVCDGSGSCCRFYGSVAFTAAEAAHARAIVEDLRLPVAPHDLFTPITGAQLGADDVRAVAQIDGRCVFLENDGLCLLHRRGGAAAKPFPCRFYPAMLMDDGEQVRVSIGPECACAFASAGRTDGAPLVPRDARTLRDLGPDVAVMHVPDPVPLTGHRTAPRRELARWSAQLVRALEVTTADAIAIAWTLADHVHEGLDPSTIERSLRGAVPAPTSMAPWLDALAQVAASAASTAEAWRGGSDLSRRVARWMTDALAAADLPALLAAAPDPAAERFYLRVLAHGHRLAVEGRPLEHGLRDRATRILAARAMSASAPPLDSGARYPLALLEASMRNLGLARYADGLR